MDGSIASIGAMYVYGESGPTPSSGNPGAQYWYGSTVEVGWINCEYDVDRSMPWSNCVYGDPMRQPWS